MTGRPWHTFARAEFDPDARPEPLAMFPEPDPTGTPDLFDTDPERTTP